jgi:hypothetical protein
MLLNRNAISLMTKYPFGRLGCSAFKNVTVSKTGGFNEMEKLGWQAGKVKDSGNSYDFGVRIYESRLGRRWNVDPKPVKWLSPISCFLNNPICFNDVKGDTNKGNTKGIEDYEKAKVKVDNSITSSQKRMGDGL